MIDFSSVTDITLPNNQEVIALDINNVRVWEKNVEPVVDKYTPFFIESDKQTVLYIAKSNSSAPTISIQSSDDALTWTTVGSTTTSSLNITLYPNKRKYLRANTRYWATSSYRNVIWDTPSTTYPNLTIGGNIMSLLYGSNFTGDEVVFPNSLDKYIFSGLFYRFDSSTSLNRIKDASKLILPVTTLNDYCYYQMFENNILTESPILPAKILKERSYGLMFYGCTYLTKITCLATDISASNCTLNWVKNVAASGTFIKDASMSSWTTGTGGIPSGWTVQNA